jgi:aminoglycoside 2''-phosphotransferase
MSELRRIRQSLAWVAPELDTSTLSVLGEGMDSIAYCADGFYPLLDAPLRENVTNLYESYGKPDHFRYQRSLLHGDLWPDHILCDPRTRRPCGIIDFNDVTVGDPDFDLMPLYGAYGPEQTLSKTFWQGSIEGIGIY